MKKLPIESPCIGVCQFISDKCRGCGRTQEEAFTWYEMPEDERNKVWARIAEYNKKQ